MMPASSTASKSTARIRPMRCQNSIVKRHHRLKVAGVSRDQNGFLDFMAEQVFSKLKLNSTSPS
jgi:hypothetical protein